MYKQLTVDNEADNEKEIKIKYINSEFTQTFTLDDKLSFDTPVTNDNIKLVGGGDTLKISDGRRKEE